MARVWDADVDLTEQAAVALVEGQFPELAPVRMEPLGVGWDNAAYCVNGRYVFRFPRRQLGAELLSRECRILPLLAAGLPLPIPQPCFVGEAKDGYPYPFAGYPRLPGTTACRLSWTAEQRAGCAAPLGRFLAVLHSVPVDEETCTWAPGDDIRRADLARRLPQLLQGLDALPDLEGVDVATLRTRADDLAGTPPSTGPACWVHGDLYARHLLADNEHRLCGVIDWGDVHLGDRALDLSIAFSFLPPSARHRFRDAYGDVDEATWRRAQFRALFYGPILWTYGSETGDHAIQTAAEYILRNLG